MAFDLGGFLKKRWDTSVIRDAVSSNTAADQQRRQVAAQKAAPVQTRPNIPYYGSFSPQVTNQDQAVQQTGRDLGRMQREGQITGQQFNDRFSQLLASTTKDSNYKTPIAQAGNFAKSIVKPFWETGDTVVKGAQLGVANATNNTQAADNARLRRDQSYQDSIVKPVAQAGRMVADTPVGYLIPGNSARKSAEKQNENKLIELRDNTESFTQNKAKEIQDGIRAGVYDPQKAQAAIQELLAVSESANAQLGQFYDDKLASQGLNKDMTAAQAYATAFGNLASTAGLLISPASGTAIRQAGGNVVRRGIAELGTNSALNGLGGAASAYGQGADLEESLKAGLTQAGVGAVMMGAGYLKGPAAVETNIPAAPGSLRESIQAAKQNVRLAINNPDGANVFKINNPLDAKTTGLDINNPMGAQTKPLDVRNPLGAETGKKLSIVDRYKQATDIDAPKQDGFVRNPLANDAPQGKTPTTIDNVKLPSGYHTVADITKELKRQGITQKMLDDTQAIDMGTFDNSGKVETGSVLYFLKENSKPNEMFAPQVGKTPADIKLKDTLNKLDDNSLRTSLETLKNNGAENSPAYKVGKEILDSRTPQQTASNLVVGSKEWNDYYAKQNAPTVEKPKVTLQEGRANQVLDKKIRYNGQVMTRSEYVDALKNDGYTPTQHTVNGKQTYAMKSPKGDYYDISKIEYTKASTPVAQVGKTPLQISEEAHQAKLKANNLTQNEYAGLHQNVTDLENRASELHKATSDALDAAPRNAKGELTPQGKAGVTKALDEWTKAQEAHVTALNKVRVIDGQEPIVLGNRTPAPQVGKTDPLESLKQEAKKYKSAEEFRKNLLYNDDIILHQTGKNTADKINKEGFKSGKETGLGEKRSEVYGMSAYDWMNHKKFSKDTYARDGSDVAEVAIDTKGLKIIDRSKQKFTDEEYVKGIHKQIPEGYDGVKVGYGNGVNEVLLKPEVANARRFNIDDLYTQSQPPKSPPTNIYDYSPESLAGNRNLRLEQATGQSYAEKFGVPADKDITIYRGVPVDAKGKIEAGDWVTADRESAKMFARRHKDGSRIITQKAKAGDIRYTADNATGYADNEFIYKPAKSQSPLANDAPQVGKTDPLESLKQEARKYGSAEEFVKAKANAYHGTQAEFAEFDNSKMGSATDSGMFGKGFYLTDNPKVATEYTRGKGKVMETYADLKNPYQINSKADIPDIKVQNKTMDEMRNATTRYSEAFTKYLKDQGYDGVIDNTNPNRRQIIAFDASQLKTKQQLTDLYNQATQSQPPKSPLTVEKNIDISSAENFVKGKTLQEFNNFLTVGGGSAKKSQIIQEIKNQYGTTENFWRAMNGKEQTKSFSRGELGINSQPTLKVKPTLQDALEGKSTFTPISQPVDNIPAIAKRVTASDSTGQLRSAADKNLVRLSKQEQLPPQISRTEVQAKSSQSLQNDSLANGTTKVKLNTNRLKVGEEAMARLDKDTQETITKMSNQDIQRVAKDAGIDTRTYTDEQVRTKIAEQLNVRQDAVRLQNEADAAFKAGDFKTAEEKLSRSAAMGRVSREQGTDLARQLQARRIIANELDTPQQRMFKLLDNAGVNPEVYTKRLARVDFTNPQDVVKAYRELVPAKASDWLDTVRYNSMLSSPLTHIVNAASNALNVGVVAPLEKTIRGIADATGGLFGKERKYAAGEGAAYATGAARNIKKAAGEFLDVMRGIDRTQNLDLQEYSTPLAIGGVKGATYNTLSFPMKMLGASDKFFRTLAEGGETAALNLRESKGIKLGGNKRALAEAEGAYRLYQQDTNLKGQGGFLQSIDSVTNSIMKLRKDHTWARFVFPFVKTPTNILKQGVEFSPLGFANAVTAADKTTALTRAAIGTAVFGASAAALGAGDLTWGTPTNKEARDRFLAEGKQPYAIRIGGKWVSFAKLPPAVSFPFALTAGIDDALKQKKISESTADAWLEGVAKWGQFLGDQSYVKNIGDTLAAFKGDADRATQAVANYPQQVVPFRALTGWIARMTDDTERKVDADKGQIEKQVQSLLLNYPGLRQKIGTRDYRGQPIPANNPVLNSFSPFKITDQRAPNAVDAELDATKAAPKTSALTPKQTSEIEKLAKAKTNEYQNQLIQSDEYKALSSDDKRKRLASLAEDVKAVESRKYQNKYSIGERALDFTGKETVLTKNQVALLQNSDLSAYKSSTSTPKTKVQSDYEVASSNRDLTMTRAKANNDLAAWNTAAAEEYDAIGKQIKALDPKTDQVKINTLIKKQEALQRTALGYKANGYIKKTTKATGKGSKGGKFTIPTSSVASSARTSTFTNLNRLLAGTTKTNSNKGKIGNKVALRKITVKGVKS